MTQLTDNTRGALLMMASMACFTFGDAAVKSIGEALPLSQILVVRGLVASSFIAFLAWRLGQLTLRVPGQDRWLILLRAFAEVGAAFLFLSALRHMPLGNLTALLQMAPLTVTLGSALVFSEPVGWRRWSAIAAGFGGMLLIVRPGTEGFDQWSLFGLGAVLCVTVRDLATKRMSPAAPTLTVTLVSSVMVVLCSALWGLVQDWQPITGREAGLLAIASVLIVGGYSLSVLVMRVGDVGFVAPFRYTGLVWALILGLLIFGEWPKAMTLIGAGIIVATGLYTLWRETRLKRTSLSVPPKTARM